MDRLVDKIAFITGAAVGFGRAFARAIAAEGGAVAIADIDLAGAQWTAAQLEDAGYRALAVRCDATEESGVDEAVARAVAGLGGVDILINNAGKHLTKYNQPFHVLPRDDPSPVRCQCDGDRELHGRMPRGHAPKGRGSGPQHLLNCRLQQHQSVRRRNLATSVAIRSRFRARTHLSSEGPEKNYLGGRSPN